MFLSAVADITVPQRGTIAPERRGLRPPAPGAFAPAPCRFVWGGPPIAVQSEGGKLSGEKGLSDHGGAPAVGRLTVGNPERRPVGRSPGYPRGNPEGARRGAKAPVPVFNSCADRRTCLGSETPRSPQGAHDFPKESVVSPHHACVMGREAGILATCNTPSFASRNSSPPRPYIGR